MALQFIQHFCAGNVDALAPLLADDLQFTRPLLQCSSRTAYLESLHTDPPEPSTYRILGVTDSDDTVAVFYDYEKPSGALAVAQQFRFKDGQIAEIFLVFDASGFTRALS